MATDCLTQPITTGSVARIALVGIGVGGTLTISRLAEQVDSSCGGITLDIVDRPENLGRSSAFGSDSSAAAVILAVPARLALSVASLLPFLA